MSDTTPCRVRDLKPGTAVYSKSLGGDIRVDHVEVDGDTATVWLLGKDGEPFPFSAVPADAEVLVYEAG
jgi:hypothetical protein